MKKWYLSWTLWLNLAVALLGFLGVVTTEIPALAGYAAMVQSALNVALRFKTTVAISK